MIALPPRDMTPPDRPQTHPDEYEEHCQSLIPELARLMVEDMLRPCGESSPAVDNTVLAAGIETIGRLLIDYASPATLAHLVSEGWGIAPTEEEWLQAADERASEERGIRE